MGGLGPLIRTGGLQFHLSQIAGSELGARPSDTASPVGAVDFELPCFWSLGIIQVRLLPLTTTQLCFVLKCRKTPQPKH